MAQYPFRTRALFPAFTIIALDAIGYGGTDSSAVACPVSREHSTAGANPAFCGFDSSVAGADFKLQNLSEYPAP